MRLYLLVSTAVSGRFAKAEASGPPVSDHTAWGKHHYDHWVHGLSPHEKMAAQDYKMGGGFKHFNGHMRGTETDPFWKKHVEEYAPHLDRALSRAHAPHDLVVHRGISGVHAQQLANQGHLPHLMVGKKLHDPAYTSTSISEHAASQYLIGDHSHRPEARTTHDVMLHIHVPKGAHGAYMDHLGHGGYGEKELLLPRGRHLTVHHAEWKPYPDPRKGNTHILHLHAHLDNPTEVPK